MEKVFSRYVRISDGNYVRANLVADYTSPSEFFGDFGTGLEGEKHDGTFTGYTAETVFPLFQTDRVDYKDTTIYTSPVIPNGALVYDSFNRTETTRSDSSNVSLGSTEGGSLGILQWQAPCGWGILGGYAFSIYNQCYNNTLKFNRQNVDLRVARTTDSQSSIGLVLRYTNDANLITVTGGQGSSLVGVVTYQDGNPNYFQFSTNYNWLVLRAVVNGNLLIIYTDNNQVGQLTLPLSLNGTEHGLRYAGNISMADYFVAYPVN